MEHLREQWRKTTMALPDFKTDRKMSEKQFISACTKILKDIAREFGYTGGLPEVQIDQYLDSEARSLGPSRELPNGAILISSHLFDRARDPELGYGEFRIVAHEAIHALLQASASYANTTQALNEGGAEIISVAYWAMNGPGYGMGTPNSPDRDAIHEKGRGWVGGDVALTSMINYPEWIVEVMSRAASKVGWNAQRIVDEVKRAMGLDRYKIIDWIKETDPNFRFPGPRTAEGMLLWMVQGLPIKRKASGQTIYRGYKIDFPSDVVAQIQKLTAGPLEESEIDQHLKLGPILVRWMERHHWESGMKLGRHWTSRRSMAETAAYQGAARGYGVLLEATYRPEDVNPELTHTTPGFAKSEDEVNLKPGAQVTITGVYLTDTYGWDKTENLIASPIRSTAAKGEFLRGVTGVVAKDVAASIAAALNRGDKAAAGRLVCDWFAGTQGGYNDSGGIGSWWGPGDVRNQIVYYAEGGNLYTDPSGTFSFPPYEKSKLGILLHGTPDGDKEPGGYQFRGDVQIASVEIYHRIGDEFSSTSGWVSCPVGKRYPMGR